MTHETTAPVQSLHDQIMRLPCTPPKDANVNQMLAYKSGHRDARHAAAELAAAHEVEQAAPVAVPDELRAKAEKFVISRRQAAEFDRVAESELEDEDADEAQACAVQAFFHEEAAALVEQLLSAAPTPPAQQVEQPASHELLPDEIHQIAFEEGQPAENGDGYWFTAEEFDLFVDRLLTRAAPPAQQSQWVPVSERLPEVADGDEQELIVCVRRARNGESYVFSARYLNKYPLYSKGHPDADEDGFFEATGWHDVKEHSEYDGWYSPLIDASSGDEVTHWMSLPTTPGDTAAPEQAERDAVRAEVERLRKDAALFRRLRDLPDELLGAPGVPCVAIPEGPRAGRYVSGPDLDAALEASR